MAGNRLPERLGLRSGRNRYLHLGSQVIGGTLRRQRRERCRRVRWIARLQRRDPFAELGEELVEYVVDHDHPLRGHAHLPRVPVTPEDRPLGRLVDLRVLEHDEWIRTAELERALLRCLGRVGGDDRARRLAAGKRDTANTRVIDHVFGQRVRQIQVLERSRREPGTREEVVEHRRGLRHVAGVLEQDGVAGKQLRRCNTYDLVVGEVPRLDRQQHPEGLADDLDLALRGRGYRDLLGLKQRLPPVGVVLKDVGRQVDFGLCLCDYLPHLEGQQLCVPLPVGAKQFRSPCQDRGPRGEGGIAARKGMPHAPLRSRHRHPSGSRPGTLRPLHSCKG